MIGKLNENLFSLKKYLPGPGSFNPKCDLVKERSPSPIIGTSKREEIDSRKNYPGIGDYEIREKNDGISFVCVYLFLFIF